MINNDYFKNNWKIIFGQYLGIILGAIYGIIIRVLWGGELFSGANWLFSVTFMYVIPIILGIFPILFSGTDLYKSTIKQIFYPVITVILFLVIAVITRLEDFICLLIFGLPFILIAALSGLIVGIFIKNRIKNKHLFSLLLIPFILQPIENLFSNSKDLYVVNSSIIIDNNAVNIWPNLVEVPYIQDQEYVDGIFQHIGIPRPLFAKLENKNGNIMRVGVFTDGLILRESITDEVVNKSINFKIDINQSTLRNKPTDIHILRSHNFEFENISYTLQALSPEKTQVTLSCSYYINSKLNWYANFWSNLIIKDFETRLLHALKIKLDLKK